MRPAPPPELVDLLTRLGLALPGEVRGMWGRVRRLARDLPAFESVWVDALAQARKLTPYQAAQINVGRGESLAIGPYVIAAPLPGTSFAATYRACQRTSTSERLLTVVPLSGRNRSAMLAQVESLIRQCAIIDDPAIVAIRQCGLEGSGLETAKAEPDRLWVDCSLVDGVTAQQWMVHNGRFPSEAVLEIARQMAAGLAACEHAEVVHGDLSAGQLWLSRANRHSSWVRLPMPGLRAIVRPVEGFTHADLDPVAYDGLAPERIRDGTLPTVASDLFACGCLWWNLLTGRPPLTGATALAKMRASLSGRILDVRELAPDTPQPLAEMIAACMQRDPQARPQSFAVVVERLGVPTRQGAAALARCLHVGSRPLGISSHTPRIRPLRPARWRQGFASTSSRRRMPVRVQPLTALAATGALLIVAVATWPVWKSATTGYEPPTGRALTAHREPPARASATPKSDRPGDNLAAQSPVVLRGQLPERANAEHAAVGTLEASDTANTKGGRGSIVLATATRPLHNNAGVNEGPNSGADFVLPAGRAVAWTDVRLQAGQIVRGPEGKRSTVLVSQMGAKVAVEDVRFENIDFVFSKAAPDEESKSSTDKNPDLASLVRVSAFHCEFHGCTFRSGAEVRRQPAAITWQLPAAMDTGAVARRIGKLQFSDCVMSDVAAGVRCQNSNAKSGGELSVEMTNVLHLGPGPLASLEDWPRVGEPVVLRLQHSTVRNASGLVECRYEEIPSQAGKIRIEAIDSVLVPESARGLVILRGDTNPALMLPAIDVSGNGSVLARDTPLIEWQQMDGHSQVATERHVAADGGVSSQGLVRGEVEFEGPADGEPTDSRVVRWQAPLRSGQPPGIGEIPLKRPVRAGR